MNDMNVLFLKPAMSIKKIKIYTLLLLLLCSCHEHNNNKISFDAVKEINGFPKTVNAGKGESVTLNSLGNLEFTVQDSLMIVSTAQNENAWKIVDLRSDSIVSEVINSGHGEWEFDMIPQVFMASFFKDGGNLKAYIPETSKGCYTILDISATLDSGKAIFGKEDNVNFSPLTIYSQKSPSGMETFIDIETSRPGIKRRFLKDNSALVSNNADYLNRFEAASQEQVGRLIPRMAINPSQNVVAEVYDIYPQINIYSITGDFAVTLAPDGKIMGPDDYEPDFLPKPENMIYNCLKGYDNFFVVNRCGENSSHLLFIDWQGNPLLELNLDEEITSFDIDFISKTLYTLNFFTDTMKNIRYQM